MDRDDTNLIHFKEYLLLLEMQVYCIYHSFLGSEKNLPAKTRDKIKIVKSTYTLLNTGLPSTYQTLLSKAPLARVMNS